LTLLAANGILQGLETKTQEWVGKAIGVGLMVGFYLGLKSDSAESFSAEKGGKWLGSHCRDCGEARPFDEIEIMAGNARCKPGYGCKQFTKEEMEETKRQMRKKYSDAGWDDFSAEDDWHEITTFQPFMKKLPAPGGMSETTIKVDGISNREGYTPVKWNLVVQNDPTDDDKDENDLSWRFYPTTSTESESGKSHTLDYISDAEYFDIEGEGDEFFHTADDDGQDYVYVPKKDVMVAANEWLKNIGVSSSNMGNNIYEGVKTRRGYGVYLWMDTTFRLHHKVLKEWEDYWKNKKCNHEDWDFKIIEEVDNELLLTLKCLNCDKRAGVSTPLSHKDWMAEAFSAEEDNSWIPAWGEGDWESNKWIIEDPTHNWTDLIHDVAISVHEQGYGKREYAIRRVDYVFSISEDLPDSSPSPKIAKQIQKESAKWLEDRGIDTRLAINGSCLWDEIFCIWAFPYDELKKSLMCAHEDWDFKIIEEVDNELLLTLKCLNCGKRAGTSAPLKHDDWMAEAFSAESFSAEKKRKKWTHRKWFINQKEGDEYYYEDDAVKYLAKRYGKWALDIKPRYRKNQELVKMFEDLGLTGYQKGIVVIDAAIAQDKLQYIRIRDEQGQGTETRPRVIKKIIQEWGAESYTDDWKELDEFEQYWRDPYAYLGIRKEWVGNPPIGTQNMWEQDGGESNQYYNERIKPVFDEFFLRQRNQLRETGTKNAPTSFTALWAGDNHEILREALGMTKKEYATMPWIASNSINWVIHHNPQTDEQREANKKSKQEFMKKHIAPAQMKKLLGPTEDEDESMNYQNIAGVELMTTKPGGFVNSRGNKEINPNILLGMGGLYKPPRQKAPWYLEWIESVGGGGRKRRDVLAQMWRKIHPAKKPDAEQGLETLRAESFDWLYPPAYTYTQGTHRRHGGIDPNTRADYYDTAGL